MIDPNPLAETFPFTPATMLRHSDGQVISWHFDADLRRRAEGLGIGFQDLRCLRQIADILIAITVARRDAGEPEAFLLLTPRLQPERWTSYLQLAMCQLLEQWEFEEARRLGLLLKESFCSWLREALNPAQSNIHLVLFEPPTRRDGMLGLGADNHPVRSKVRCDSSDVDVFSEVMRLCPSCGNKRCPHAENVGFFCTASNAPGQVGRPISKAEP